jgi:hypothetical protein
MQSIDCIFHAIDGRIANLEGVLSSLHVVFSHYFDIFTAIFKQKNLDIKVQLSRFAFGMVSHIWLLFIYCILDIRY